MRIPQSWFARGILLVFAACVLAAVWGICLWHGACRTDSDASVRDPSAAGQQSFVDLVLAELPGWLTGKKKDATLAPIQAAMPGKPGSPADTNLATPAGTASASTASAETTARIALLEKQQEQVKSGLASYQAATRYSLASLPIDSGHDQAYLFEPFAQDFAPFADEKGKPIPGMRLRTTQSRVFLSGTDTAVLTLQAVNEQDEVQPITIRSAPAQSISASGAVTAAITSSVDFNDSGANGDQVARDGRFSAVLSPAAQGFGKYRGTIRVLVSVQSGSNVGVAGFDLDYSPGVPAQWAGARDALEAGSLNVYLKAKVAVAGSYRVSARVDDANGAPFALLEYSGDSVAAGEQEFKLPLFGLLVADKKPAFPLRIRDVEGYLLDSGQPTDRQMMPRWSGVVHRTGTYALSSFSTAEWQGEQRTRHQEMYKRDLEEIKAELSKLR